MIPVLQLPGGLRLVHESLDGHSLWRVGDELWLRCREQLVPEGLKVEVRAGGADLTVERLAVLALGLLLSAPEAPALLWEGLPALPEAVRQGLLTQTAEGDLRTWRAQFWQWPQPWLRQPGSAGYPALPQLTGQRRHPCRPPKPTGEVYRRYDHRLGAWIALRALAVEDDLPLFHRWQNQPRVAAFWQEEGSLEQHRAYLQRQAADPHVLTLVGSLDDQPFAYFEAYWAAEDRIAPFYAVDDYDRGIHMLVGEDSLRGPQRVACWLPALVHYLLLDEPRTRRIVSEPRADNERMIGHLQRQGFYRQKDFDFPHKRAALMLLERERFFDRCVLA
ncbi:GNAT family N-acetyltransferase [uncultured Pseudomonas sp.]|uniref:GNAT family N-acetyltransferase n=1 Tax=uncultured Pseudomonas sp. TaxID=114707 RepID=UPI0025FFE3A2|nr:GNAT family N-acetyltransferase [uncultured Pseudomonas sp.]